MEFVIIEHYHSLLPLKEQLIIGKKTFATSDREKVEIDLYSFGYTSELTNNYLLNISTNESMKSHPCTNQKVNLKDFRKSSLARKAASCPF